MSSNTFVSAGLLTIVSEALDDETLMTVISNFSAFCESISMAVVERVLYQLFGSQWKKYYEAYRAHCVRHASDTRTNHQARPQGDYRSDEHPWGAGYELEVPKRLSYINAYATRIALETLTSIATNCKDFDYSFIPGQPRDYGIDCVWFAENGRLIWIQYHRSTWVRQSGYLNDETNRSGTELDPISCSSALRFDGQVILTPSDCSLGARDNDRNARLKLAERGDEVWDLAGSSRSRRPQCVWSSLSGVRADNELTWPRLTARPEPVRISTRDYCSASVPSKEEPIITNSFVIHRNAYENTPNACTTQASMKPMRFLQASYPYCVLDMLHSELLEFHGQKELLNAQLSDDLRFLGALVTSGTGEWKLFKDSSQFLGSARSPERRVHHLKRCFTLALWTNSLPRPQLLWEDGISGLCVKCEWVINNGWLIVHCQYDGTFAYYLASSVPKPIDITCLVGKKAFPVLKVCGPRNDVLICCGLSYQEIAIVQFMQAQDSTEWSASPVYLSTACTIATSPLRSYLLTTNYIQYIGRKYFISATGDLFDLESVENTSRFRESHTSKRMTLSQAPYAINFKVLAIHEFLSNDSAIVIGYMKECPSACLQLRLISSQRQRELKCYDATAVPPSEVQFLTFSPSGHAAFVVSQDPANGDWVVVFTRRSIVMEPLGVPERYDFRFLWVDNDESARRDACVRHARFLAYDMVGVADRAAEKWSHHHGDGAWFDFDLNEIAIVRFSDRRAKRDTWKLGQLIINDDDDESPQRVPQGVRPVMTLETSEFVYRRWIDILQECPRSPEYCRSINWTGTRVAMSPGGRFLLYPADREKTINAAPHIEMRDLTSTCPNNQSCLRRSPQSLYYYWLLREGIFKAREELWASVHRDVEKGPVGNTDTGFAGRNA